MPDTRLLEQRGGVTFMECFYVSIHSELLPEWERLYGKTLLATSPINRQSNWDDMAGMSEFADFVYSYVFSMLPEKQ